MRALSLLLVLSAVVGGCADIATLAGMRQTNFMAPGKCGDLARQRLADAASADLAEGYEKAIFERSYRDCLAAEAKYGSQP